MNRIRVQPLVSIIIPSYNHSKYISHALCSVDQVNYENIEVLIVDDGSIDSSCEKITTWLSETKIDDSRITFITRENKGVIRTLNQLIDLSKGKYIFILASDDMLVSDSIGLLVDYCENNCNSKSVLYSNLIFIDEDGRELGDIYMDCKKSMLRTGSSNWILSQMLLYWRPPFNLPFF